MQRRGVAVAGLVLAMAAAGPAQAQIAWDSPMLIGPRAPAGFGIYLMDPWPGSGIAVMGTYRTAPVPVGAGFRLGLGEGWGGRNDRNDLAVFGGVDLAGFLARANGEVPIDILWFAGAGAGIGRRALLSFPLGLTIGGDLAAEGLTFRPYVAPRVVLDACLGDRCRPGFRDEQNLRLDLAVDLGLDLVFAPGWAIRFGAALGNREALAIGVAF